MGDQAISALLPARAARAARLPLLLLSLAAASACGGSKNASGFATGDGGDGPPGSSGGSGGGGSSSSSSGGSSGGPILGGDGGSAGDAAGEGCPPSATLVYVTGQGDTLYSFYPPTQTFTLIGKFNCLTSPTHMTVDRQANAWVVANGQLYKASTANASCSAVSTWKPNIGFLDFSLTFIGVTNAVDNTLYLMNNSADVATFDIASGKLTSVGKANISGTLGDMTSNGDGTLYFLQDVSSPTLYDLSPKDATTLGSWPISATGGGSQALAFWGGSFYAFENDAISQYDPAKKTTAPIGTAPLKVTGAGQSTCVPKVPPPPK